MKRIATLFAVLAAISAGAQNAPYTIYPIPQQQQAEEGTASFNANTAVVAGPGIDEATVQRALDVLKEHGITACGSDKPVRHRSNVILGVNGSGSIADKMIGKMKVDTEVFSWPKYDRHILSLSSDEGAAQVVILGENTDAVFCGLASLEQMLDNGSADLPCVTIHDGADIRNRGIIEGYYGVPYTAEVTKDLFRFMARYKLNTYMYGAKSDPYHSRFWSDQYPESITDEQLHIGYLSQSMLKDITDVAHSCKVNFIWAIHPGRAFTNPEDKDVNKRIMEKFESMYGLGVRQFGVFVDDVGVPYDAPTQKLGADRLSELQGMLDGRWNTPGAAPADTVKPLHYVPQLYAYAWASPEKARMFFQSLSSVQQKVNIYITGRAVWTVPNNEDLSVVKDYMGRTASWWWNYPCNDNDVTKLFTMDMYTNFRDETHIDSMSRLEDGLNTNTLIINPMQQGEVSKISLFSLADYSWNTAGFDNSRSWEAAIPAVIGKERAATLRFLAPFLRYYDADAIGYEVAQYKNSVKKGSPRPDALKKKLGRVIEGCAVLKEMADSECTSDVLLYEDMKPWVLKLEAMAKEAVTLLDGGEPSGTDFDNAPEFQFDVLRGMGKGIVLRVRTAEPSAEVLQPFIGWLAEQKSAGK